jgi:hypothetical protein
MKLSIYNSTYSIPRHFRGLLNEKSFIKWLNKDPLINIDSVTGFKILKFDYGI